MKATLVGPAIFDKESAPSTLPIISGNHGDDHRLPPRPPSVCDTCWKGPFAAHFGLPCASPQDGQWYRTWPEEISYSTSKATLASRADAGCVWCQFLLRQAGDNEFPDMWIITVRGTLEKWDDSHAHLQWIYLQINGVAIFDGFVYTAPDNSAAPYITTRSPVLDVGSPHALALARQQVDECVHRHECCAIVASPGPRFPSRLVDCSNPARPRLVSTTQQHGEYVALSYVWGGDQVHKTTTSNLSMYEQGIAPSLLPATIRDAIYVTHTLRFWWLWIDSLCIVQDSDEDKRHEIGRMHHIYRYAHLTIMAASANGAEEGFLQQRPRRLIDLALPFICPPHSRAPDDVLLARPQVGQVYLASTHTANRWYSDDLGSMSTRAWCLQEYLMSPRALIFTSETLQFRCRATKEARRNIGNSLRRMLDDPRLPDTLFLHDPPVAEPSSAEWKAVRVAWMEVVKEYSRRIATVESDKLLACAAVAEQFHYVLGCEYLAGVWRSDTLLTDLLWGADKLGAEAVGHQHSRPTAYRAPSWSWAAIEGVIYVRAAGPFPFTLDLELEDTRSVSLAKIIECRVTLEDASLPFGRVTDGALVLSGALIPCRGGSAEKIELFWTVPLPSLEQARRQQCGLGGPNADSEEDEVDSTNGEHHAVVTMDCDADDLELPGTMWLAPFGPSDIN
ncbi:HET-domain-containing protein [Trametes versicolor FP-101664 SS1]|uniref:HET-domain-containing protein n=1 Tax=Trametes versicolor (strain FP-101664) TaxID=717944 RepID=UPI0004623A65|nr:HET-domain-containing protein [Trametes versicolor FP-101664 SS1]EIW52284.1 HET-domain-containing protein [Trametes versicolor FP-101664 SS1]